VSTPSPLSSTMLQADAVASSIRQKRRKGRARYKARLLWSAARCTARATS
jgi:hypothetical protein